jgi:hypothetical protein
VSSEHCIGLRASPLVPLTQINRSRCGPCGVVGDATSVVQAQRQIHRVLAGHHTAGSQRTRFPIEIAALRYVSCGCVAIRGSSPFIDCGFDRRRTSHPVAVPRTAGTTIPHSQGHRAREGGSTLYCISAYHSHCLRRSARPDPTGLIRPAVELAIMIPVLPNTSACLHDSTRRDLTMADVSREDDEQIAGERDDRNATDPAALAANALTEPTAERTGRLVSHPHPGKLDHCSAQTRITGLRDTLFGRCCHSSRDWEPGRHRPPTAVGSQTGGTDPQGRAR